MTEEKIKPVKEKKVVVGTEMVKSELKDGLAKSTIDAEPITKDEATTKKTSETKKEKKVEQPRVKKTRATVKVQSLPISLKQSMALCNFVRGKSPDRAIQDLELVLKKKMAVPMKGELPHRKGNIMSGRFPQNSSEAFMHIVKSVVANARATGVEEPFIIVHAKADQASRPYGRFGAHRKKRTHVELAIQHYQKVGGKK